MFNTFTKAEQSSAFGLISNAFTKADSTSANISNTTNFSITGTNWDTYIFIHQLLYSPPKDASHCPPQKSIFATLQGHLHHHRWNRNCSFRSKAMHPCHIPHLQSPSPCPCTTVHLRNWSSRPCEVAEGDEIHPGRELRLRHRRWGCASSSYTDFVAGHQSCTYVRSNPPPPQLTCQYSGKTPFLNPTSSGP